MPTGRWNPAARKWVPPSHLNGVQAADQPLCKALLCFTESLAQGSLLAAEWTYFRLSCALLDSFWWLQHVPIQHHLGMSHYILDHFGMSLHNPSAIFGGKTRDQNFDTEARAGNQPLMKIAATKSGGYATEPAIVLWENEVLGQVSDFSSGKP